MGLIGNLKGAVGNAGPAGPAGAAGAAGTPGPQWFFGVATPPNTTGIDNDLFLNVNTGDLRQKTGGVW